MRKTIFAGITACIMGLSLSAFAAETKPDISYDNYSGILEVSGKAETGSFVTFEILSLGSDYEDLKGTEVEENIFYVGQTEADENGYSFVIDFAGTSGVYKALVVDHASKERNEFDISLINPVGYEAAVTALNAAANSTESNAYESFKVVLNDNIFDLGFDFDIAASEEALTNFYSYVKSNNLQIDEADKNARLYKSYVLMSELEDGGVSDVLTYLDDIYFETDALKDNFTALAAMNGNAGTYTTQKLNGKTMTDIAEFNEQLKIAYILGTVRYANGYEPIVDALEDYGSLVGITGTISSRVCQQMNKNDYNADDIDDAYRALAGSNNGSPNGGVGGGNGSGSSANRTSTSSSGASAVMGTGTPETRVETAYIFTDMPETHWAAEAVLWLKGKGIVSGTDTGAFEPDREVTREEFTKMIVNACGLETSESALTFADVESGEWYYPYINTAVQAGIVKGIDEETFGIGRNITRQDMAVMTKRALDTMGISLDKIKEYTEFSDQGSISDYAAEGIKYLYESGVINGKGENIFDPAGNATRAEAAKIIYEAFREV